jgi:hypothetical protein
MIRLRHAHRTVINNPRPKWHRDQGSLDDYVIASSPVSWRPMMRP